MPRGALLGLVRWILLALLPLAGCISPDMVARHADPPVGWPTLLFEESSAWCATGEGAWAFRARSESPFWERDEGLTLDRRGTLTLFSARVAPGPPRYADDDARLAGIARGEAAAWLRAAGFERPGDNVTLLEAGRVGVPPGDLAPFCTRLARDVPFLEERDDRAGCEDGATETMRASTPMGARTVSAYCGGASKEMRELLAAARALREDARARLGLTAG